MISDIVKDKIAEVLNVSTERLIEVTQITNDSRKLKKGSIFFAQAKGLNFIPEAFQQGAQIVVVDYLEENTLKNNTEIQYNLYSDKIIFIQNARAVYSKIISIFYERPSSKMQMIGVTGTNGKTTTQWLCYQLILQLGKKALRSGTLGLFAEGVCDEESLTTPDAARLEEVLNTALNQGINYACLEVSSHALSQKRVAELDFDVAIFTNITRDHLDYHKNFEDYFLAKKELFELLKISGKANKLALVCSDSLEGQELVKIYQDASFNLQTFGFEECINSKNHCQILDFSQTVTGASFTLLTKSGRFSVESPLIAKYNALNLVAAILSLNFLGFDLRQIIEQVKNVKSVPGRLESCGNEQVQVFVDYAHTPDALENALLALKPIVKGRLLALFGCGGNRDSGKRPIMAEAAAKYADAVIVTSDNPRFEDPNVIIKDILSSGIKPLIVEADRRKAIEAALKICKSGDVLLIAGKGHENYQIIGDQKNHFSDQDEVYKFFNQVNFSNAS